MIVYFSGKIHISQLSLLVGFAQKLNYFIVHPIPSNTNKPVGNEPAIHWIVVYLSHQFSAHVLDSGL